MEKAGKRGLFASVVLEANEDMGCGWGASEGARGLLNPEKKDGTAIVLGVGAEAVEIVGVDVVVDRGMNAKPDKVEVGAGFA